ncbi:hypothetical protein STEG23_012218 [Scotinomys teguina]
MDKSDIRVLFVQRMTFSIFKNMEGNRKQFMKKKCVPLCTPPPNITTEAVESTCHKNLFFPKIKLLSDIAFNILAENTVFIVAQIVRSTKPQLLFMTPPCLPNQCHLGNSHALPSLAAGTTLHSDFDSYMEFDCQVFLSSLCLFFSILQQLSLEGNV